MLILSVLYVIIVYVMNHQDANVAIICSFVISVLSWYFIYRVSGTFLSPIIWFLIMYYFFQNGQFLLYAFGFEFNAFYLNLMGPLFDSVALFSSASNIIAGLAGVIVVKPMIAHDKIQEEEMLDSLPTEKLANMAFLGFIVCSVVAIPLIFIKFRYVLMGGYDAVRAFEDTVFAAFAFAEYMFMPFCILSLVFDKIKVRRITVLILCFAWLVLTALCGDRTTGVSGLFALAYMYAVCQKKQNTRKINYVLFPLAGLLLIVLIRVAYMFRLQMEISLSALELGPLMIDFVSEVGFSCFPLFMVMTVVPQYERFQSGLGYLAAFISGFIPSIIDPTGTIRGLEQIAHVSEKWQSTYYSEYSFGFGYSLNAEAYANLGWFGLIVIFFVALAILTCLQGRNLKTRRCNYSLYVTCVLLFEWTTLARRDSYYIWKAILYCILLMNVYIRLTTGRKLKEFD